MPFNAIVRERFINKLESGLGLQRMRRVGLDGKRGRGRAFQVTSYHKHGLEGRNKQGTLWELYGPFQMKWSVSCWGYYHTYVGRYGGAKFVADFEYQYRDFGLYLLENEKSLSFKKGNC